MKDSLKLATVGIVAALSVVALTGAAASATTPQQATARTAVVNGGQVVALPPVVAPRAAVQPKQTVVRALNTGSAAPSGGYWQARQESIFGRQSLILPAGAWLSTSQAAAALGVGSVQDSGWAGGAAGGYRVNQSGGGWSGGSGGWAMIQAPTSGLVNEILYVQWR